ncbi:endospore germination permease [Neobacillus sp.]|uniref:GerAB/ArcD/ProY family transporter n=1 Tax=Neobacillus sp. TaxID=2675273 RepID=UPI0035B546BD
MTQKISNFQLIVLVANFILSSSVITLPQIIIQVGGQNAWLVPIILYPIFLLMIFLIFGKTSKDEYKNLFAIGKQGRLLEKGFVFLFLLFVFLILLRDLRAMIDFISSVLLPNTPIDILMILSILVIVYIAMSGLEVIARINGIHFFLLTIVTLIIPFLLINESEVGNLLPLPNFSVIKALLQSSFIGFSWLGEFLLFLLIIGNVNPIKAARRAVIQGTTLGFFLFFLVLVFQILVLGTKIVTEATYPAYILFQQIHLTDFLDRLDLFIVAIWLPTIITKIAFLFYAFNHCLSIYNNSNTNKFLFPISFILGYLSVLLFKNSMEHLHFSFETWCSLGLILEFMILILFIIVKKSAKRKGLSNESN